VTGGTPATRAAQKSTTTIPIVMVGVGDPVGSGFVRNLARPEGNITGNSIMGPDISLKQLEFLLTTVPKASRVAVLLNPTNPVHAPTLMNLQTAAQSVSVEIVPLEARSPQEIGSALSST